ncbi:LegC family aminotransferase [Thiocapsa rosea]|uniref:dTDP-4-amino-4,6-dideoxygalactose transaminase n=1 Tax=Thiocapsa rosea TaxID=69360 RepID=A0A495VB46_9GAMM|nr:LegC family aminotransferase [Thiocapsa rosea]RKT45587.1 dTDP-4-amino-4,6-dideoxygalactose transaminase [Thiocapsa rosea]
MAKSSKTFDALIAGVRAIYGEGSVPLHRPVFEGNERQYLVDCIDSNFVSSVGAKVTEFEERIADFTRAGYAVATVNGTAALHMALELAGVGRDDEVITQALTFVATCNAARCAGAWPVFVDVDRDTLGLSPTALRAFFERHAERRAGVVFNRSSGRRLAACVPMHTFGHPCRIGEIVAICDEWGIPVVEDAAESLGSFIDLLPEEVGAASAAPTPVDRGGLAAKAAPTADWNGLAAEAAATVGSRWRHTGTLGRLGTLSFNGNKIITTGGGGMIVTDDAELAARAKHLTTTAKVPHPFEFVHDQTGYNYRMPNLNAALGCAQMERLPEMLAIKAEIARRYAAVCAEIGICFLAAPAGTRSNHWLNAILLSSAAERDAFLEYTNAQGVMTRPIWRLMSRLAMYADCQHDGLENSLWLEERVVNLPSSVPEGWMGDFAAV